MDPVVNKPGHSAEPFNQKNQSSCQCQNIIQRVMNLTKSMKVVAPTIVFTLRDGRL